MRGTDRDVIAAVLRSLTSVSHYGAVEDFFHNASVSKYTCQDVSEFQFSLFKMMQTRENPFKKKVM